MERRVREQRRDCSKLHENRAWQRRTPEAPSVTIPVLHSPISSPPLPERMTPCKQQCLSHRTLTLGMALGLALDNEMWTGSLCGRGWAETLRTTAGFDCVLRALLLQAQEEQVPDGTPPSPWILEWKRYLRQNQRHHHRYIYGRARADVLSHRCTRWTRDKSLRGCQPRRFGGLFVTVSERWLM